MKTAKTNTTVEFIYDRDCPNIKLARGQLLRAFSQAAIKAKWVEWECHDAQGPWYIKAYGSPTILVDGQDVAGEKPCDGVASCRLYTDANGGFDGAPSVATIVNALKKSGNKRLSQTLKIKQVKQRSTFSIGSKRLTLPALLISLLPVGVCPACWPAYGGLLGAIGLGFLLNATYLLPVTAIFLMMVVGTLAYKAKTRRGYLPFMLGVIASVLLLVGKFLLVSNAITYSSISLLVLASIWNSWPRKNNCINVGTDNTLGSACICKTGDVDKLMKEASNRKKVLP